MDVYTVCILNLNKTWMIQINPSRPFQYILDCTCQNGLSASISMKIRTGIEHYSLSYLIVTYDPTKQQIHILICQTKQKSIRRIHTHIEILILKFTKPTSWFKQGRSEREVRQKQILPQCTEVGFTKFLIELLIWIRRKIDKSHHLFVVMIYYDQD